VEVYRSEEKYLTNWRHWSRYYSSTHTGKFWVYTFANAFNT